MRPASAHAPIDLLTNALYAGAGLLLAYALLAWLVARPAFALHHIDIRGGLKHVDEAQVRLLTERNLRGNFFTVDLDKVRSDFEKLPWVSEAHVTRHWPDRLAVELSEHQPLGVWNGNQLVSTNGVVFNASADQPLPRLYGMEGAGPEVSEAYQKFSALLSPLGLAISELSFSARRAWRLKTAGRPTGAGQEAASSANAPRLGIAPGLEIALGRKDAEARLSRFARQYTKIVERLGTAPAYADLRYADGFALKRPAQQLVSQL